MKEPLLDKLESVKSLGQHPVIEKPLSLYSRNQYSTPLFVLKETLLAFYQHNGLGLSASLSFYAMFALIPMMLLMFFLLSHVVISSDYAIVKLAILTSNLAPKLSNVIMLEVFNVAQHKAVWGVFGVFALFWMATPLATAIRASFYTISAIVERPSFIKRKMKDAFAVMGMLMLFFLFTFSGLVLDAVVHYFHPTAHHTGMINSGLSLALITGLVALFYHLFFPAKVEWRQIFLGSFVTALLWLLMQPAFNLFLSLNASFGSMFGGMKNMFISIGWLYYTFVVFLFGTVLISTLRKREVLLLRGLFTGMPKNKSLYLAELMARFGNQYPQNAFIFKQGDDGSDLYYLVSGDVALLYDGQVIRTLHAGDYFGEMAILTDNPRVADAQVVSERAEVVRVSAQHLQTLLLGEPQVTMQFLKQMANRLYETQQRQPFPRT